jgi:baculoviral IAP repeat-containing protein 2/3
MFSKLKHSPVMLDNSSIKHEPTDAQSNGHYKKKDDSPSLPDIRNRIRSILELLKKPGALTPVHLLAAGFKYTGDGDKARCDDCKLEISNWTSDMNPFDIHSKQKPDCPFIRSTITSSLSNIPSSSTTVIRNATSDKQENPSKRQKLEKTNSDNSSTTLLEIDLLLQVRRRTFSHWPHRTIPSSSQMIEAGFFNCNVGDRVICIYCNLICQQWTPHTDDPCEVHKTLSPNCIYVKAKLIRPSASSIIIVNESSTTVATNNHLPTSNHLDPLRSNEIVFTAACNPAYAELPKRHASFTTWPHENLPPVDDLVRAGFFYTGTKTIVTCFYCNGSLQNWGPNDNPMIEHARWFPHCAYAKQLCGDEMYRKIQESKRAQQERARAIELRDKTGSGVMTNTNVTTNSRQLLIPDESTLSRLVAARLDLPISQRLLDQNFKLSIIKRCWEDQLRLKQDDFVSECDLFVACLILQKQIEHIDGKKENIVIPSIRMEQIRERNEGLIREQTTNLPRSTVNTNDVEMTTSQSLTNESTSSQSSVESTSKLATTGTQGETKATKQTPPATHDQEQSNNATPSNPCVLCLTEEKRLACIPCGHLATCVPCGHSLRSCPICRREIEAFVRIYI